MAGRGHAEVPWGASVMFPFLMGVWVMFIL